MDNGACSYRRFLDGDDTAIAEIVGAYKDGLILYLNGYVHNVLVAEELAEDTFFRLITKKPRFGGNSSFKSFLYAIGRNVAVDYIRHCSKMRQVSLEEAENYIAAVESLEQTYLREEQKLELNRALAQLPDEYRHVLWLSFFEDFSNQEIAAVTHKNERQVRNLLYRAKQSLKSILEKEGFVYEDL